MIRFINPVRDNIAQVERDGLFSMAELWHGFWLRHLKIQCLINQERNLKNNCDETLRKIKIGKIVE